MEYYTPTNLADFLVKQINMKKPKTVIDICAGNWNLLNSAKSKWPQAEFIGVDIDNFNELNIVEDGRNYAFNSFKHNIQFDLVLANPPFKLERISQMHLKGIERYIKTCFSRNVYNRLENTMLLANLLIVKNEGILAAILPISVLNSINNKELRVYIAKEYNIERVIILPSNSFGKEINTAIVIFKKTKKFTRTEYFNGYIENNEYKIKKITCIPRDSVELGNWGYSEIQKKENSDLIRIYRNQIASNKLVNKGEIPIVHSTSIVNKEIKEIKYIECEKSYSNYTKLGDILIVRIGRKCGEYSIVKDNRKLLTTDCVLIVRAKNDKYREKIINKISTIKERNLIKGVTTKYLTKVDLLNYLLD